MTPTVEFVLSFGVVSMKLFITKKCCKIGYLFLFANNLCWPLAIFVKLGSCFEMVSYDDYRQNDEHVTW